MTSPAITAIARRGRPAGPTEDSRSIRLVVAIMVEIAMLAVIAQRAVPTTTAAGVLLLAPFGYGFSYVRRRSPSVLTKLALAVGLLVALGSFLRSVEGARSFDDARVPLASLFLWVQVLHSFDVPRRRDLGFSVVSSLILIAEAGALSFGTGFLLFLLPWLAVAAGYLFLTLGPRRGETPRVLEVRRPPGAPTRGRRLALARTVATWTAVAGVAASAAFVALPRLPGLSYALPPFHVDHPRPVRAFDGRVVNPGLSVDAEGVPQFSDLAYPGFSSSVDLRSRGRLSDDVVLTVRSPQAALWRGLAYDTFDGTRWTTAVDDVVDVGSGGEDGFEVPSLDGDVYVPTQRILATFYVRGDLPNVVFGAYRPTDVYFPASRLSVDGYGSVRSPILLENGVVYSVFSDVPVASPDLLRATSSVGIEAGSVSDRYLQLPADLPPRVAALARRITAGAPTRYDAVVAVERWLQRNTRYDLDIPPDPPGVDAVDEFLFERRAGFCEHIASAMAVLLRAVGIPTRFVTGFGPGDRNPFTGYWEVRASDAHAWVEVFYPGAGWITYDPTFGVPPADPGLADRFVGPDVLKAVGRFVSAVVPGPVRAAGRAVGRGIRAAAGTWPVWLGIAVAAVLLVASFGRRRSKGAEPPVGVAKAFADLEVAMGRRGHPRADHQTAREYVRAVRPFLGPGERSDAELIVDLFEVDRFSGRPVGDGDAARALEAAGRIGSGTD